MKRKVIFLKEVTVYEDGEREYRLIGVFTSKKHLLNYFNKMVTTINSGVPQEVYADNTKYVLGSLKVTYDERTKTHTMGTVWGGGTRQWYMEEGDYLNHTYGDHVGEIKVTYL